MSAHPHDQLPLKNGGALIFTPCPGTKGVGLAESLAQLAQAGASAVVTLMPDEEMLRNQVSSMPRACEEAGLRWFHFPIEDDCSPGEDFQRAWQRDRQHVQEILDSDQALAVHCKGGSGRTGLMVAIIMLERGLPYREVVRQVRDLRPRSLRLAVHIDYLAGAYDRDIAEVLSEMDGRDASA